MRLCRVGLLLLVQRATALHNVTVDDMSSDIIYSGTWLKSSSHEERYAGTTHYTKIKGSYASFSFTGAVKVYFMGLGIRNRTVDTTMTIALDGVATTVDQYRAGSLVQAIMWSSGDLDVHSTHTIRVQKTTDDDGCRDLNVDAFILTIPDETSSLVSTSSTSKASTFLISQSSGLVTEIPSSDASATVSALVWSPTELTVAFAGLGSQAASSATIGEGMGPVQSPQRAMSASTIVGTVLGSFAVICMLGAGCFLIGRYRRRESEELLPCSAPSFQVVEKGVGDLGDDPRLSEYLARRVDLFPQEVVDATPIDITGTLTRRRERAPSLENIRVPGLFPVGCGRPFAVDAGSQLPTESTNHSPSISEAIWDQDPPAYSPAQLRLSAEHSRAGRAPTDC